MVETTMFMEPSEMIKSWQEEIDDLIGDADAALSSSPQPINLSSFLPSKDVSGASETTAETPMTLPSLHHASSTCSHDQSITSSASRINVSADVANFLDYLKTIRFEQTPASSSRAISFETGDSKASSKMSKATSKLFMSSPTGPVQNDVQSTIFKEATNNWANEMNKHVRKIDCSLASKSNPPVIKSPKTVQTKHLQPSQERTSSSTLRRTISEGSQSPDQVDSIRRSLENNMNDSIMSNTATEARITLKQISEDDWTRLQLLEINLEIALKEAYTERQLTRDWAHAMKLAVQNWVQEQRAFVELERQHAAEMISEKERFTIQENKCATLRLGLDIDAASSKHEAVKASLQEIIHQQAERIVALEERLTYTESRLERPNRDSEELEKHVYRPISTVQQSPKPTNLSPPAEQFRFQSLDPPGSITPPMTDSRYCISSLEPRCHQGRQLRTTNNCSQIFTYRNGAKKEIRQDGSSITTYVNGDTKTVTGSLISYYHAAEKTTHTKHAGGLHVYEYRNRQIEHHHPDGVKDILYPNGARRRIHPDGTMETSFADGIHVFDHSNGVQEITRAT